MKADSSSDPIYKQKVERKEFIISIAKKHTEKMGISYPNRYTKGMVDAMMELDNLNEKLKL